MSQKPNLPSDGEPWNLVADSHVEIAMQIPNKGTGEKLAAQAPSSPIHLPPL